MDLGMSKLASRQLAFVGCGNLGRAILGALLDGAVPPDHVRVSTRRPERGRALAEERGVRFAPTNVECVQDADIIVMAVKPQILPEVLEEVASAHGDALVISLAAGVRTDTIEAALGGCPRVVRAMPNTPALIHESATAVSPGAHATEEDVALAVELFAAVGRVTAVDEVHLDAVTGLSGSGPAYVFLIVEAFADAGVRVGLSREVATDLAIQTIRGSAGMLQKTGEHPGRLKDQVTSPGGTAIAGLHTLEEGGLRTTIMNAVHAAYLRAGELGAKK